MVGSKTAKRARDITGAIETKVGLTQLEINPRKKKAVVKNVNTSFGFIFVMTSHLSLASA